MTFWQVTKNLLIGFGITVELFALTLVLALPLGLVIAFGSMTRFKPLKLLTRAFVWVIRGTPLMLQIFVVFYLPGMIWGVSLPRFEAALIAFVINYAAYFSEIYRGGIESISRGQYEAGQVLGMTKTQIFCKVVLLQVVKRIVPPMSNEIITLVKDTSLVRVIAVVEILMAAYTITANNALVWPLFYTGAFYLIFVGLLTVIFSKLEKKLTYFRT